MMNGVGCVVYLSWLTFFAFFKISLNHKVQVHEWHTFWIVFCCSGEVPSQCKHIMPSRKILYRLFLFNLPGWNECNKINISESLVDLFTPCFPFFRRSPPLILCSVGVFMWNKLLNSCSSLSSVTCVLPQWDALVHCLICHVILIPKHLIYPVDPTVRQDQL